MKRLLETCMWLTVAASLSAAGCGSGLVAGGDAALIANEDSAAFLDRMSSELTVSENDAMRGLIVLLDGEDGFETFSQRAAALRARDIIGADWDVDAAGSITRGRLAYMIYQATKVHGGIILTLTGPSERYCLRELQYRSLMGDGAVFTPVTGLEFVGVLGSADTYIRTGKVPDKAGQIDN